VQRDPSVPTQGTPLKVKFLFSLAVLPECMDIWWITNLINGRVSLIFVSGIKVSCPVFLCLDSHYFHLFKAHGDVANRWFLIGMKQISKVEKKQFTSSLNIWPNDCCRKGWGRAEYHLPTSFYTPPNFIADLWIFHSKTTEPLFSSSVFPSCFLVSGGWRIYCREHVRFRMHSFHIYKNATHATIISCT
jgi:hypothetical protein